MDWQLVASYFTVKSTDIFYSVAGRHYRSVEEVIAAVEEFFRDQDEGFYTTGMHGF